MKYLKFLFAIFILSFAISCSATNNDENNQLSSVEFSDEYSCELDSSDSSDRVLSSAYSSHSTRSAVKTNNDTIESDDNATEESIALRESDSDRIIYGLDGEPLGNISDLSYADNTVSFEDFTYVIQNFKGTFVSFITPEYFNEEMEYIGDSIQRLTEYKTVRVNDNISSMKVSEAKYSQHTTEYSKDYPQYSRLALDGKITLTGLLVRIDDESDYGALIYGYKNVILFLPYAESLNEECFPALHSEIIAADFYVDSERAVAFYGDTLPFVFEDNMKLDNLLGQRKYAQVMIALSDIQQEWSYYNGSGWSPCFSEVIDCSLL